jgi:allantoate deiminase
MLTPFIPLGARICERVEALAAVSSEAGAITRAFLSPEHRRAAEMVLGWMVEAGMDARIDAIGNVCGRYEGRMTGAPAILLGSHLDTVRNAGRWDGALGIVAAIECVAKLDAGGVRLPHAIEIVGFCDDEGGRFGGFSPGSRAFAGELDAATVARRDAAGVSVAEALRAAGLEPARIAEARRAPGEFVAALELRIERGPALEAWDLPVGCVTAVCGATRLSVTLAGLAGDAGAVPMDQRADALAGAAACILAVEQAATASRGLVATVGRIAVEPGGADRIPSHVAFTVDARAPQDAQRLSALRRIEESIVAIASTRRLGVSIVREHDQPASPCSRNIQDRIDRAIASLGYEPLRLACGAAPRVAIMSRLAPMGMIFVRCRDGVSRSPAEHVAPADIEAGAQTLLEVLRSFDAAPDLLD